MLPLVVVGLLGLLQVAFVAHTAWAAEQAARAAARAHALGADAAEAARGELPRHLERALRVRAREDGDVEVRLRAPRVVRAIDVGSVSARARFAHQR